MNDSFFSYLHRLELIAFFSGYPLVYAIALFSAGYVVSREKQKRKIVSLLPFAYALTGTLYLGFQLKILYPNYSVGYITETIHHPFLVLWGISAIFFWIPALAKKPFMSLLHSMVFFFILLKDIFQSSLSGVDKNIVRNDMKLYSYSLLLNAGAVIIVIVIYFLFTRLKLYKKSSAD